MTYDTAVIGAGPGGSIAAIVLARAGRRVTLIERASFPRWKVCGACLGSLGVKTLREAGLGGMLDDIGAKPITTTQFAWRRRTATMRTSGMVAISRRALDTALAERAADAGVEVRMETSAEAGEDGAVRLRKDGHEETIRAESVIQASGLRPTPGSPEPSVSSRAYIGLGVASEGDAIEPGVLLMAVGARGYVGVVRTEDGRDNWAAAVDPAFIKRCGSPALAIAEILDEAGYAHLPFPVEGWKGTPALTRKTPSVSGVIRRIGDAAGYVEPITGEGMSWALAGGARAAQHILDGRPAAAWGSNWSRLMLTKRARCFVVSRALRSPTAMLAGMQILGGAPVLGGPLMNSMIGAGPSPIRNGPSAGRAP